MLLFFVFFFKQKTAYEMRISDWSSDVCSSDLPARQHPASERAVARLAQQRIVERLGFMPVRRWPVVPVGVDLGEYRLQAHRAARVIRSTRAAVASPAPGARGPVPQKRTTAPTHPPRPWATASPTGRSTPTPRATSPPPP